MTSAKTTNSSVTKPITSWCLTVVLALFVVMTSFWLGKNTSEQASKLTASVVDQHQASKAAFQDLQFETLKTLQQMNVEIATLQAQATRLDALGQALVKQHDLAELFNFDNTPAVGGPVAMASNTDEPELSAFDQPELKGLSAKFSAHAEKLHALEQILLTEQIASEHKISGRPIQSGWLSSSYGKRRDPFRGHIAFHKGVDFAGRAGDPVIATAAGIVTYAGYMRGYGNLVEIEHADGLKTRYGHNQKIMVKVGDRVAKQAVIAKIGNTGRSTGPHVHYEILKQGKQINPYRYLKQS